MTRTLSPTPTLAADQLLKYGAWTRRLARSLVDDRDLAEDLAQDAWIATLRQSPDTTAPLGPWFRKIIRHQIFNRSRERKRRQARERDAALPDGVASPEELVGRIEMQKLLVDAVLGLAEPYRQTLLLRYFEELSSAEIAERMRVPASTVRGRLKTALALVRDGLDSRRERRADWLDGLTDLLGAPAESPGTPQSQHAPGETATFDGATRSTSPSATSRSGARPTVGLAAKLFVAVVAVATALPAARWLAKRSDPPATGEAAPPPDGEDPAAAGERSAPSPLRENPGRPGEASASRSRRTENPSDSSFTGIVGVVRVRSSRPDGPQPPTSRGVAGTLIKLVEGLPPALVGSGVSSGVVSLRLIPRAIWPRFQFAGIGQPILVENNDLSPRSVKITQGDAVLFDEVLAARSVPRAVATVREGDVIRVEHSDWSGAPAFVGPTDNAFHAVVGAQGRFSLGNLPPGTYTVEAWHQHLGKVTTEATVPAGGVAEIGIVFEEPSPTPRTEGMREPCQFALRAGTPIEEACRAGGRPAAKRLMKVLVAEAKSRGHRFRCEGCHRDLDSYELLEGAREKFAELLAVVKEDRSSTPVTPPAAPRQP